MNLKVSVSVNSYYYFFNLSSILHHLFFFFSYNILKQILYMYVFIYCCNK